MQVLLSWLAAAQGFAAVHPALMAIFVWPIFTAIVTWFLKPRTPAEYDAMWKPLAEVVRLAAAFGLDAPKVIAIVKAWFPDKSGPTPPSLLNEKPANDTKKGPGLLKRGLLSWRLRAGLMLAGCLGLVTACIAPKTAVDTEKLTACVITDVEVHNVTKPEQIAIDCGEASAQVVYDLILDLIARAGAHADAGTAAAPPSEFVAKLRAVQPPEAK